MVINDTPSKGDIAFAIRSMTYIELREFARDLSVSASARADPVEELGGFDIKKTVDWAELLADWAEGN